MPPKQNTRVESDSLGGRPGNHLDRTREKCLNERDKHGIDEESIVLTERIKENSK